MRNINTKLTMLVACAMLASGLAGCGKAQISDATPEFKGIYTTSVDCADSGRFSYEDCSQAMAKAVDEHEKDAPTYASAKSCVAKEGEGKCEFTAANGKYRPRLLAFLVTSSKPPKAKPLYAHPKGDTGFRDISSTYYTTASDELVFSEHAQTMFEAHAGKKRGLH